MDWQTDKAIKAVETQVEKRDLFAEFARLGIAVDSGRRRRARNGDLEIVWVLASDAEERFEKAYGHRPSL